MGWFGKLTLGSLGMFLGGPLGAIAGAALGHHLIDRKGPMAARAPEGVEQAQAAYFISLFSILGKLAKVDGVVTRAEVDVVGNFINGLQIPEREKLFAKQVFNEAKTSPYTIDDFALQLYRDSGHQPGILLSFLNLLFQIVAADGTFHPAEETALKRVKDIFRISDQQFDDLKALYFNDLDRYYRVLNASSESSDEEIRSNYKKLVKDFHPDRIVSKGLPEEFTDFAASRFREIQEAYEKIRSERRF